MDMVSSIKLANGSMLLSDISKYKTSKGKILQSQIGDFNIIVPGSSSGGALLLSYLDAIEVGD